MHRPVLCVQMTRVRELGHPSLSAPILSCAPSAIKCHPTLRHPEPSAAETFFSLPLPATPEVAFPVTQSVPPKWAALQNCLAQDTCPSHLHSCPFLPYSLYPEPSVPTDSMLPWVEMRSLVPGRTAQYSHTLRDSDLPWVCLHPRWVPCPIWDWLGQSPGEGPWLRRSLGKILSGYQEGALFLMGQEKASSLFPSAEKALVYYGAKILRALGEITDISSSRCLPRTLHTWCSTHSCDLAYPCQPHLTTANFTLFPPPKSQVPQSSISNPSSHQAGSCWVPSALNSYPSDHQNLAYPATSSSVSPSPGLSSHLCCRHL